MRIKKRIKKISFVKKAVIDMYQFTVTYELPPMEGTLNVDINAKDEHESLYIVRNFLYRAAIVRGVKQKHYQI
ncbi:hypothetical protein AB3H50_28820 [Bacillus pacificus]|uniref:hypothetical protein n=1 Tax=Bacillus pacificus TaxID=2026187 RepID=UPI003465E9A0